MFRSTDEVRAVTDLVVHGDEVSVADLVRRTGTNKRNVERSIDGLEEAGIIKVRPVGRTKLVSANTEYPGYVHLKGLLEVTVGPPDVLRDEFKDVEGVESIRIFGSWARRDAGEPGPPPNDLDVVVVSRDAEPGDITEACLRAEARLLRQVQVQVVEASDWAERDTRPEMAFWTRVMEGATREVAHTPKPRTKREEVSIESIFADLL
jgi:predicted nucleotidyltransferase